MLEKDDLSDEEMLRYSRQIMLPKFDYAGQLALSNSRALIIGAGGLGCPAALYLTAAGIGAITLVDDDVVELSNLQRQILHTEQSIGDTKVNSAKASLAQINRHVEINAIASRLEGSELEKAVSDADIVLDCSDTFTTRFAVNAACVQHQKPLVSGAAIRMEGQVSVFDMRDGDAPCYQCLYPDAAEQELNCSTNGVMAPLVGIIGAMQAMEAIKVLTGLGESLKGRLMILDAHYMQWRTLKLKKDEACACCAGASSK